MGLTLLPAGIAEADLEAGVGKLAALHAATADAPCTIVPLAKAPAPRRGTVRGQ